MEAFTPSLLKETDGAKARYRICIRDWGRMVGGKKKKVNEIVDPLVKQLS